MVHSMLSNINETLSTDIRIKLVSALILPHLDYCCLVYHGLAEGLNLKLQRLLNLCIRFIYNLRRSEHITPYRQRLSWLSVENRRLYFLGIMAYRVRNLTVPAYISDLFCEPSSDLRHSTRHSDPQLAFHIPLHRTTTYCSSFRLSAAYFWNSMPQEIVSAQNLRRFKGLLFEFLRSSEL